MVDCRFEVRLKQHTPMIHFQHDQAGATLRATEVKPKLDRYVRKHLNAKKDDRLRYQAHIRPVGEPVEDSDRPHSLYFGNMGNNVRYKHAIRHENVDLCINAYFDKKLADAIYKAIPECFAQENFGTRQNKGFGSFYPDNNGSDSEISPIETVLKSTGKPIYYFGFNKNANPLDHVDALYKAMKSGINGPREDDFYFKSLLWRYFNKDKERDELITWEKRFMKQSLIDEAVSRGRDGNSERRKRDYMDDPRYLRIVLGLTDSYTYKYVYIRGLNVTIDEAGPDPDYGDTRALRLQKGRPYEFNASHPKMARFKSPITFKPVGHRVYVIADPEAYKPVLGQKFTFQCGRINEKLKAPDEFDIADFLAFAAEQVNAFRSGGNGPMANRLKSINLHPLNQGG